MVSARFDSFLIIFILLPLRFSSAHSQHQVKKRLGVATGSKLEMAKSSVNVERIYHKRMWFLPKRKIMSQAVLSKSKVVESEGNGNIAKGSTTKGKVHCMMRKCNHEEGQGILNVKHKFSNRSGGYAKVKMSGTFVVPLNADYYVPRPHPPKNN